MIMIVVESKTLEFIHVSILDIYSFGVNASHQHWRSSRQTRNTAIDGNFLSFSHIAPNDFQAWLSVDLRGTTSIETMIIHNHYVGLNTSNPLGRQAAIVV
jgi:hypothetical protein